MATSWWLRHERCVAHHSSLAPQDPDTTFSSSPNDWTRRDRRELRLAPQSLTEKKCKNVVRVLFHGVCRVVSQWAQAGWQSLDTHFLFSFHLFSGLILMFLWAWNDEKIEKKIPWTMRRPAQRSSCQPHGVLERWRREGRAEEMRINFAFFSPSLPWATHGNLDEEVDQVFDCHRRLRQAVNKDLTSSSKFSGSCVLTLQTLRPDRYRRTNLWPSERLS